MDKIFLRELKTEAIIGIFDWERQVRQTLLIDLEFNADVRRAALSDSIDDTLNYKRVAKRVQQFVEESSFHLVESLAEHIAMLLLDEFGLAWVKIVLNKPGAIRSSKTVGIMIERERKDLDEWRAQGREVGAGAARPGVPSAGGEHAGDSSPDALGRGGARTGGPGLGAPNRDAPNRDGP